MQLMALPHANTQGVGPFRDSSLPSVGVLRVRMGHHKLVTDLWGGLFVRPVETHLK